MLLLPAAALRRARRGQLLFVLLLRADDVLDLRVDRPVACARADDDGLVERRVARVASREHEGAVLEDDVARAGVTVGGAAALGVRRRRVGQGGRHQREAGDDDGHQHGDTLAKRHSSSLSPPKGIDRRTEMCKPVRALRQRTTIYYHKRDKIAIVFSTCHYEII